MTEQEKQAIADLVELIRAVMAGGGFKKIEDLDKQRDAIATIIKGLEAQKL